MRSRITFLIILTGIASYAQQPGGCTLPRVDSFTAIPDPSGGAGAFTIYWSADGADTVSFGPPMDGLGTLSASGSVNQTFAAGTTVNLSAANACGTSVANLNVSVGPPAVTAIQSLQGEAVTSAVASDVLRIAIQNPGDASANLGVVFTTPDGLPYQFPIDTDASGNLSFTVPVLPGVGPGALTVQVSASVNGQITPTGQTLSISLPVYSGDAVADFGNFIKGIAAQYQDGLNQYGQASGDMANATAQQQMVAAYLGLLQDATTQIAAGGSAQMAMFPPSDDAPNPPMVTLTAQDLGLFLALVARSQQLSSPLPLARVTDAYHPLDSSAPQCSGQGLADLQLVIRPCKFVQTIDNALVSSSRVLATAGLVALVTNAASGYGTLGFAAGAGNIAFVLSAVDAAATLGCFLAPIWFDHIVLNRNSIPYVGMNPGPNVASSKVQMKAVLVPKLAAALGSAAQGAIALAGRYILPTAIGSLITDVQNAAFRNSQIATAIRLLSTYTSGFAGQMKQTGANPQSTSGQQIQVGYCGDDLLNVVPPARLVQQDSQNHPFNNGFNDFYWYGIKSGRGTVVVHVNEDNVMVFNNQTGCGAPSGGSIACRLNFAVGPGGQVSLWQGGASTNFNCSIGQQTIGSSLQNPDDQLITYDAPVSASAQSSPNAASIKASQVLADTWSFTGSEVTAVNPDFNVCTAHITEGGYPSSSSAGILLYLDSSAADDEQTDPPGSFTVSVKASPDCQSHGLGLVALRWFNDAAPEQVLGNSDQATWTLDPQTPRVLIVSFIDSASCSISGTMQFSSVTDEASARRSK